MKLSTVVKREGRLFFQAMEKSDERPFFLLLSLFVISKLMYMEGWIPSLSNTVWYVHQVLFTLVMWGSTIYLFSIVAAWRDAWNRTGELLLIGGVLFAVTGIISRIVTTDSYAFVMGAFFCLMARGKNYKKILYCYLSLLIASLAVGLLGLQAGITVDAVKPARAYGGHSLGIIYPNNFGFIVFAVLASGWYLFLKKKRLVSVLLFWATAVFMFKYITCYTVAGMAAAFPLFAIGAELMEERAGGKFVKNKAVSGAIIALPFVFFLGMLLLCWQMDWVRDLLYGTPLHTLAMRFVEGGYALRLNGVSLFGHPFRQFDSTLVEYAEEIEMIFDSAFIHYLVIRGVIPMGMTLGWLSLAHGRCLKNKDMRLLAISVFMLLLSVMERPGLDVWYNFVFFYPLVSLASLPKESAGQEADADVKVIVATHKPYWMPSDPLYIPVQVGAEGKPGFGCIPDNTGENISSKNAHFCELTGLYWAWKNLDCEYLGLAHYRRHFTLTWGTKDRRDVLTLDQARRLLRETDVILLNKRHYLIETNYQQYVHAHHAKDLDETRRIIEERHPEYLAAYDSCMRKTTGHRFNMFIMKKELADDYCGWLFDILFELEKRLDISHYSERDQRVFGFVSERLMDVWLEANEIRYKDIPYIFLEKENWIVKGVCFVLRKFYRKQERI